MIPSLRAGALSAVLLIGGHGFAQQSPAPAPLPPLTAALDSVVRGVTVPGLRVGVAVAEATSGRVVYQHDADLSLNPASNAKILTAATALATLGAERRFATTLRGELRGGIVRGALVLHGEGDPSLRTSDLYELARTAHASGLRRVEGDLVVDDTRFGVEHLPPAFDQQPNETAPFRAAVGAVSVDENALSVRVLPGAAEGRPVTIEADPPGYLVIESDATTSNGGAPHVSLELSTPREGRATLRVHGRVPLGGSGATVRRRLEAPAFAAGYAMRAMLEANGIRVTGSIRIATAAATLPRIALHESAPLSSLLYEVGKESNNFYAEMLLLAIAAESAVPATFAMGAERVRAWAQAAGVNVEGLVVRNGSGLYDANRLSARQVTQVLRATWRDPGLRDEYITQLAVGGCDGTLRSRLSLRDAPRLLRAKTGTLDDAIALSGYVLASDPARTLVFSVLINGSHGHAAEARALADVLATRLVEAVRREGDAPEA